VQTSSGFLSSGYYPDTVDISANDQTGLDFTVSAGYSISGLVSLPAGNTAPSSLTLIISAVNAYDASDASYTVINLPQGASQTDYTLVVQPGSYIISYCINNWSTTWGYI
jgi:hypothetical protein